MSNLFSCKNNTTPKQRKRYSNEIPRLRSFSPPKQNFSVKQGYTPKRKG